MLLSKLQMFIRLKMCSVSRFSTDVKSRNRSCPTKVLTDHRSIFSVSTSEVHYRRGKPPVQRVSVILEIFERCNSPRAKGLLIGGFLPIRLLTSLQY